MTKITKPNTQALRGPALTFTADPFEVGVESAMRYESDAIVALAGGKITHLGPAKAVRSRLPPGTRIEANGNDTLMLAGFIDSHVHFPQTPMIAAYGEQLLDWLNKYTFPTEQKYADKEFARCGRQGLSAGEPAQRHHQRLRLLHGVSAVGRRAVRGSREARDAHGGRQGDDEPQCAGVAARHDARPATTTPRR